MARAKRTQRAEARRRYRATTAAEAASADEAAEETEAAPSAAPSRPRFSLFRSPSSQPASSTPASRPAAPARAAASTARAGTQPRPGLVSALRQAAGPADIPGDIRALPTIALHSKALWVPLAITVAAGVLLAIPSMRANAIVATIVQIAIQPPPMIIGFLAGMLAPRGAWLVGGITTTVASTIYALIYASAIDASVTPLGWTRAVTEGEKLALSGNLVLTSLVFGVGVGAFAGFYRRFLAMSSPQRPQARAGASPSRASTPSRPSARRR